MQSSPYCQAVFFLLREVHGWCSARLMKTQERFLCMEELLGHTEAEQWQTCHLCDKKKRALQGSLR